MSRPIVFFGNERLATGVQTTAPTLRALLAAGYDVKAVVSHFVPGQSRSARQLEIAVVAAEHSIPVLLPDRPADILEELAAFGADVAVLVAYGKIIPQSVIDLFPRGIVNIHPSLLPLHRGPIPIESVILDGSKTTGVSVMQLVKAMDAGPVFGQAEVGLHGQETKQQLADQLLEVGSQMVVELLPGILSGDIVAMPQDDSRATYDELIAKPDGLLDWQKPAVVLERQIRAYSEWPKSQAVIAGKTVVVTSAHVACPDPSSAPQKAGTLLSTPDKKIAVQTNDGVLVIDELKPAGKNNMTSAAFLAGNRL